MGEREELRRIDKKFHDQAVRKGRQLAADSYAIEFISDIVRGQQKEQLEKLEVIVRLDKERKKPN